MKQIVVASGVIRRGAQVAFAVVALAACGLVAAQATWNVHPALQDRWSIQLGIYAPEAETNAFLNNAAGGRGTSINFEDDLNLDDRKTMPAFLASVRLGERWRVEAEYFSLHRSGSRAISRTINWGDNTYPIGTVVTSKFDSDIYRLSGGYSFIKSNQAEAGVALGAHVTDFNASLSATGIGTATGDTLAPLPTIGIYGAYAFTPRWLLSGRLDYFSLNYDKYDGTLVNFNIGVDYRFTRNFGVGVGYRHVDYDVTATDSGFNGGINYKFSGPSLYGVVSF
jgi:outer membrane autotransporter protein